MVNQSLRRMFAPWPPAPTIGATKILFTTHPRVPGGGVGTAQPSSMPYLTPANFDTAIGPSDLEAISLTWQQNDKISALNGLRLYIWENDTSSWCESDAKNTGGLPTIGSAANVQIPALSVGQEFFKRYDISKYAGFCFEYTAGASAPTIWSGTIVLHLNCGVFALDPSL